MKKWDTCGGLDTSSTAFSMWPYTSVKSASCDFQRCCESAIPFYEKLGMKKADDVMQYNRIEWTEFAVK